MILHQISPKWFTTHLLNENGMKFLSLMAPTLNMDWLIWLICGHNFNSTLGGWGNQQWEIQFSFSPIVRSRTEKMSHVLRNILTNLMEVQENVLVWWVTKVERMSKFDFCHIRNLKGNHLISADLDGHLFLFWLQEGFHHCL